MSREQMKLYSEDWKDFSEAMIIQMTVMLEFVWGAELIAYRVASTLDYESKTRKSIFQEKKQKLRMARQQLLSAYKNLELTYEDTFNNIFAKEKVDGTYTYDYIQGWANDLIHLALIYMVRGEGDLDRKHAMKRALMNFKATSDVDLKELLKYYKCEL